MQYNKRQKVTIEMPISALTVGKGPDGGASVRLTLSLLACPEFNELLALLRACFPDYWVEQVGRPYCQFKHLDIEFDGDETPAHPAFHTLSSGSYKGRVLGDIDINKAVAWLKSHGDKISKADSEAILKLKEIIDGQSI